jgi:small-conductance mechanosensitive channel
MSLGSDMPAWISAPWFEIGGTSFTLGRVVGVVAIVLVLWWAAILLERAILRLAQRGSPAPHASAGAYTLSRIARYTVWIVGTLIGLNYAGIDLTSLALLTGVIGVGIGFGLQNIFNNFVSGIILLLERTLKVGDFVDLESGISGRPRST